MITAIHVRSAILCSALAAASMLHAQEAAAARFSFQSQQTSKCMVGALDGRVITDTCYSTRTNQQWDVTASGDHFKFKNVATGKCLQASSGSLSSATCGTSVAQNFFYYSTAQSYIQIVHINSAGTQAWCYASLSGTSLGGYAYPTTCTASPARYSWKQIPR